MESYLIALDLDGTLLTTDKTIGKKSKEILLKLKAKGHKVVISTGRPFRASKDYYDELGLDTPIVNFNGAYVHHPLDKEWGIIHNPLEMETVKGILKVLEAFDEHNVVVEVMDEVYIKDPNPSIVDMLKVGDPKMVFGPIEETLNINPSSVLLQTNEDHLDRLIAALEETQADAIEQRSWGAPTNIIEIIRNGINKAVGLKAVADYYNIPQERVIAFGDEDNDIEMLSFAGHGIAMGNAVQDLKNIADDVTLTNDEEGIAHTLDKLLFSKV